MNQASTSDIIRLEGAQYMTFLPDFFAAILWCPRTPTPCATPLSIRGNSGSFIGCLKGADIWRLTWRA